MMNNPRVLLWGALLLLLFLNYQAWVHDYAPIDKAAASAAATQAAAKPDAAHSLDAAVPQTFSTDTTATSGAERPPAAAATSSPAPSSDSAAQPAATAPSVHVRTDVLDMDISLQGGTLLKADLLRYPRVKGGTEPVRLMNRDGEESFYELKSGLTGRADVAHPTQLATFTSAKREYDLGSATELSVPLTWTDGDGSHGHQDLYLPPQRLPHCSRLQGRKPLDLALAGGDLRADSALRRSECALDVLQCGRQRLSWTCDLRRR